MGEMGEIGEMGEMGETDSNSGGEVGEMGDPESSSGEICRGEPLRSPNGEIVVRSSRVSPGR